MSITLPAFTPIEDTLFLTLCGRARSTTGCRIQFSATRWLREIVRKLDYKQTDQLMVVGHR